MFVCLFVCLVCAHVVVFSCSGPLPGRGATRLAVPRAAGAEVGLPGRPALGAPPAGRRRRRSAGGGQETPGLEVSLVGGWVSGWVD